MVRVDKKKRKNFNDKTTYYTHFFLYIIWFAMGVWLLIWLINASDQEIVELLAEQELTGSSRRRFAKIIEMFLVKKWGKSGIMAVPIVGILGMLYVSSKEVYEYIRFLRKDKLYRQGLVDNLYDDYEPISIFKRVKSLLSKKQPKGSRKKYYPSKRDIKKLHKDKLYKKLYKE